MSETDWRADWSESRYSDANLEAMCREGIRAVAAGRSSGVHFKLFNRREADVVRAFMAEHSPGTPFHLSFFDFAPTDTPKSRSPSQPDAPS